MTFKIKGKCDLFFSVLKLNIDLISTLPLSHISGRRLFSEEKKNSWNLVIPSLEAETEGPKSYSSPAWTIKWDPVSKNIENNYRLLFNENRSLFSCWSNDLAKRKQCLCQIEEGWKRGRVVGVMCVSSSLVRII